MIKISTGHIIALVTGAAIGSAVTYKITKDKFAKLFDKELENMREYYLGLKQSLGIYDSDEKEEPIQEVESEKPSVIDAETIITNFNYSVYQESGEEGLVRKNAERYKPYIIPPDLFGNDDSYDTETLTYYSDGVLTDDQDNPIEDIQGMIGNDSLMHFGEYEPDAVYVRNDRLKIDFEILLDNDRYDRLKAEDYD